MRGHNLIGTLCVLALATSCGNDDDASASDEARAYWTSYSTCYLLGTGTLTDTTDIAVDPDSDPVGYAREYGRSKYRDDLAESSSDGCLDGLEGEPPKETAGNDQCEALPSLCD